jgi:hypothetical protein
MTNPIPISGVAAVAPPPVTGNSSLAAAGV